ncbi:hypothetical protein C8A05DRAFT_37566 [Staphylotrichum tortipilum]|uniref:Survival Motor Neuron Gemin2-binding domain-containing protein n=1 Tax=Staphylotrichum tortipilum TaxID=2831512 RepID=A0AAN6MDK5_9PEZI|nr:hypothetical protein C8A05DRAFT_37566 [Staphylotrichum longicolle]
MEPEAASHEEIWDDSVLIDSWNEALEEYKKYHSIHARGGTVDDIPNGAGTSRTRTAAHANANAKPETRVAGDPIANPAGEDLAAAGDDEGAEAEDEGDEEEGEVDETIPMDESDETSYPTISDGQGSGHANKVADDGGRARGQAPGPAAFVAPPQTLLGTVEDEDLKTLLMSWYYAGYYTGLFEGKQQALKKAGQQPKGS